MSYWLSTSYTIRDTLRAQDLVRMMLEYRSLCPNTDWQSAPHDNPPRYLLFSRIKAAARAFNLPQDLMLVVSGEYLRTGTRVPHEEVLVMALSSFPGPRPTNILPDNDELLGFDLEWTFRACFDLRCSLHNATLASTSGSFVLLSASLRALDHTRDALEPIVTKLDDLLAFMLDPQGREFLLSELTATYGWPTDDLASTEAEWD